MKKNISIYTMTLVLSGILLQGCSEVEFSANKPLQNPTGGNGVVQVDNDDPGCNDNCWKEEYTQRVKQATTKLDILFVTDTSGSLDAERAGVADGIKNFVGQLSPNIDFNIGVMLAHGSTSTYAGRLYKTDYNEPLVLKSKELNIDTIKTYLRKKLTVVKTDNDSDGGEEGLFSTARALKTGYKEDIINAGIFRSDAALAVVYISDENDICARYPQGVTPVVDPDGKEAPAFVRDCEDVTAAGVYAQLKSLKGTLPLTIGGVIYTGQNAIPAGGENEIGYGYTDIIALNNGISVDMAGLNISGGLTNIGAQTNGQINYLTEFQLKHTGVDVNSIKVYVNGVKVNHTYVAETNTVHIQLSDCISGSKIVIEYCLEEEDPNSSF